MSEKSVGIFFVNKSQIQPIDIFYIVIKSVRRDRRLSGHLRKWNNICNKLRNTELQYKTTCAYICKRQLSGGF